MKRYESTQISLRFDGKRIYKSTSYPEIKPLDSDIIVISNDADFLDSLSNRYYNDPTLWWIIALANGLGNGRMSVPPGRQLRIPVDINKILSEFHNINKEE